MKKKLVIYSVLSLVLLLAVAIVGTSFYMLDYSLGATAGRGDEKGALSAFVKRNPHLKQWADSLRDNKALRDTFIIMPNGERQHAIFVRSSKAEGRTAVVVHGYTDRCYSMLNIASIYQRTMGYNIILPDLHAHGLSEGDDVQMGWKDRKDILHWTSVAERMFRPHVSCVRMTPDKKFVMGFQWHPEILGLSNSISSRIFEAFIDACTKQD